MDFPDIQFPICAKCRKTVEVMSFYRNSALGIWFFTVECHGERQRTEISDSILVSMDLHVAALEPGFAFVEKTELPALNTQS